jgi:hypothetical protein
MTLLFARQGGRRLFPVKTNTLIGQFIVLLIGAAFVFMLPSVSRCEELSDFIPQVDTVSGALEVTVDKKDTTRATPQVTSESKLFTSSERLRLGADGFIYDPRFIQYSGSFTAALGQQHNTASSGSLSLDYRTSGYFDEYDLTATVLPEHPYNLTAFTRRSVGNVTGLDGSVPVYASDGAIFRYRQKPWFIGLSYTDVTQRWQDVGNRVDATFFVSRASYITEPFSLTIGHNRTDSLSLWDETLQADSYLNNEIRLGAFGIITDLSKNRTTQTHLATQQFINDVSLWQEHLTGQLPLNLSFDYYHRYHKDSNSTSDLVFGPQKLSFDNTTDDGVTLMHRLYKSLITQASVIRSRSDTSGGNTDSLFETLIMNYTKNISAGTMYAGYNYVDLTVDRTGGATILNEQHLAPVPGSFILNYQWPDPSTVQVMVKDPVGLNLVPLTLNVNYQLVQLGSSLQVIIVALPASITPPPLPSYDFVVSYSLRPLDATTETRSNSFNLKLALFEGFFNPYVRYSVTDQSQSGTFVTVTTDRAIMKTIGYTVQKAPFLFLNEYTYYESSVSPYRSVQFSTDYHQYLFADFDVLARLLYNDTHRFWTPLQTDQDEKTTALTLTAHKYFRESNLDLYASGNYTTTSYNELQNHSYTFNTNLKWHIGKVDLLATVARTYYITTGGITKQTYEYNEYFVKAVRNIF